MKTTNNATIFEQIKERGYMTEKEMLSQYRVKQRSVNAIGEHINVTGQFVLRLSDI